MDGTLIQRLIADAFQNTTSLEEEKVSNSVYKPRIGKSGYGKQYFSERQYQHIKRKCGEMLRRLEYLKPDSEIQNDEYFTDDEDVKSAPNYGKTKIEMKPDRHGAPYGARKQTSNFLYQNTMTEINEESLFRVSREYFKWKETVHVDNFHDGIKKSRGGNQDEVIDSRTIKNYLRGNVTLIKPGEAEEYKD